MRPVRFTVTLVEPHSGHGVRSAGSLFHAPRGFPQSPQSYPVGAKSGTWTLPKLLADGNPTRFYPARVVF
jgi:hypothetical protein